MRKNKQILLFLLDLFVVLVGYYLSLSLYTDFSSNKLAIYSNIHNGIFLLLLIYILVFLIFDFNKVLWSRISVGEGFKVVLGNLVASCAILIAVMLGAIKGMPYNVIGIAFFVVTLSHEMIRFSYRAYK